MGRQRREQRTAIDDEGPSGERTMVRQGRTYQRRAYNGKAAKGAVGDHRRGRAESRAYQRRAYDGKAAKNVSAESVRWEGSEELSAESVRWEGSEELSAEKL